MIIVILVLIEFVVGRIVVGWNSKSITVSMVFYYDFFWDLIAWIIGYVVTSDGTVGKQRCTCGPGDEGNLETIVPMNQANRQSQPYAVLNEEVWYTISSENHIIV